MQSLSGKVITALLSLFLLFYVGYQVYRHFVEDIVTQTVFQYTVQDKEKTDALIVRDEIVLEQTTGGVVSYFSDDGIKVAVGTQVAEVYPTQNDVLARRRIRELEYEMAQLTSIENLGSSYYLNSEGISKQLSESLYAVIKSNESGVLADVPQQKAELLANLNRKQLATGVTLDFSAKLERLNAEKAQLEATLSGSSEVITAPQVGYFSNYVDGLEQKLTIEGLNTLSAKELEGFIAGKWEQDETKIGKMIEQGPWRLVLLRENNGDDMLYENLRLSVDFGIPEFQTVPARVLSVTEDAESGKQIVILSCDYMCAELTRLRNPTVELNYQVYTGLKIPSQAVRFQNNERGVYVRTGDVIQFKKIDVVYEGRGYVLCEENKIDESRVQLYDEVVVSGIIPEEATQPPQAEASKEGDEESGAESSSDASAA